jgi:hypothetical protein
VVLVVRSVEDILIQDAGIPADILAKAKERIKDDKDLGEALRDLGALDYTTWAKIQALYYGLPYSDEVLLGEHAADLLARIPLAFAKHYQLLPLSQHDGAVTVAVVNPFAAGHTGRSSGRA